MNRWLLLLTLLPGAASGAEFLYGAVVGDRFEYRENAEHTLWDLQGWYGGDYNKFYLKTEGEHDGSNTEYAELQLLYSRAWLPYFDVQMGLRQRDVADQDVTDLVLGVQGDLPYAIETTSAVFLSEDGDVSWRTELERDILLTEQWVLQPRIEVRIELDDVPELGIESGVDELMIDLRLRYEFTRRIAPYVGVSWEEDHDETTAVAGLRFAF